ncbi:Putative ribonuclease H protein At1g65750 [Linum perenne]
MWLVVHSRLLTNLMRHRRHLAKSGTCPRYLRADETVLHVLRDCPFAVTTWMPLVLPSENQYFFETPLLPWITLHLKSVNAELHFGIVYWYLWRARNEAIFSSLAPLPSYCHNGYAVGCPLWRMIVSKIRLLCLLGLRGRRCKSPGN